MTACIRHLLIYHLPLGEPDGTSVMLRRLFAPCASSLLHLSFRAGRLPPPPEFRRVAIRGNFPWPFVRGARAMRRLYPRLAMPLLAASSIQLRREHAAWRRAPGTVLVAVYDEETAARARVLLESWRLRRFVLMVMDLLDNDPPSAARTPALHHLLQCAAALITVSPRLGRLLRETTAVPQLLLLPPCGQEPDPVPATRTGPFRVLISGALYSGKISFVETVFMPAWQAFAARQPAAELLYSGGDWHKLPATLQPLVRNVGHLSEAAYADLLREVTIGVLPVLHDAASKWRFSVPARLSDFLAAGVVIFAPPCPGTATADFLAALPPGCARIVDSPAATLAALVRLHATPSNRMAALQYARENLSLTAARPTFRNWLMQHSAPADAV